MGKWIKFALTVVIVGVVAAAVYVYGGDEFDREVKQIIRTPQSYDGENVDKLARLGPEAVPAIGDALNRGEPFPLQFIYALERIGDVRGANAVLDFIGGRSPLSDTDESPVTSRAIEAAGRIGDANTASDLLKLMHDTENHPRVRLASAAAVCRLVRSEMRRDAAQLILQFYRDRSHYFADPNAGFTITELFDAIIAADTSESLEIVIETAKSGPSYYTVDPIIEYLATKDGNTVELALMSIAADKDRYELPARVKAATKVLEVNASLRPKLHELLQSFLDEAKSGGWPLETVEEVQRFQQLVDN